MCINSNHIFKKEGGVNVKKVSTAVILFFFPLGDKRYQSVHVCGSILRFGFKIKENKINIILIFKNTAMVYM